MQNEKTEVGCEFIRFDRKPEGVQMVRRMVKFFHNEFDAINSWSAPFFKQNKKATFRVAFLLKPATIYLPGQSPAKYFRCMRA